MISIIIPTFNNLDYLNLCVKSLEKNSIDMYATLKSLYLQNREKKVNNSQSSDDDDWDNLKK